MPPMLHPYALPLAASIDESVFVTQAESCNVNFQMFRYVYEADGQYIIIRCKFCASWNLLVLVSSSSWWQTPTILHVGFSTSWNFLIFSATFLFNNNSLTCLNLGKCGSVYAGKIVSQESVSAFWDHFTQDWIIQLLNFSSIRVTAKSTSLQCQPHVNEISRNWHLSKQIFNCFHIQ